MGKNKVLERRAARLMSTARRLSRETGETAHLYKECRYAAGTWEQRRRVVIKVLPSELAASAAQSAASLSASICNASCCSCHKTRT